MTAMVQHIRFTLRQLRKNPGFTAVAVITLALGIGANTAIFSVIYASLLAPMPYPDADRLVMVWSKIAQGRNSVSAGDYLDSWQLSCWWPHCSPVTSRRVERRGSIPWWHCGMSEAYL
jgi:hypothetical protein